MRNLYRICTIGLILVYSFNAFAQTPSQRHTAKPKGTTQLGYGYYEYLPADYYAQSKLPLVIFYPGIGERGDGTTQLSRVLKSGPPKMVQEGKNFPFILISVQHPTGWWNGTETKELLSFLKDKYKVDPTRVYVTGLSAGGFATWTTGQTLASQIAALVPICGCGQEQYAQNFTKIPVWAFHNSGDAVVKASCTENIVAAIKTAGGSPKMTIYTKNAHDAWTQTYNDDNMWKWMLSQKKENLFTSNHAPLVNAGSDVYVNLPTNTKTLVATSSDSDGSIVSKSWVKVSGPPVDLEDAHTSYLKLKNLVTGTYIFRCTVTDNDNLRAYDDVKVIVRAEPVVDGVVGNMPPKINAGEDKIIYLPKDNVTFSPTYSDADGKVVSGNWLKVSGPDASLINEDKPYFKVTDMVAGTYIFKVTVTDNSGATGSDEIKVVVKEASSSRLGLQLADGEQLKLYPNPVANKFRLNIESVQEENVQVQILNSINNKILRNQNLLIKPGIAPEMNIEGFEPGVYMVVVSTPAGSQILKLIKE